MVMSLRESVRRVERGAGQGVLGGWECVGAAASVPPSQPSVTEGRRGRRGKRRECVSHVGNGVLLCSVMLCFS